MSRFSGKKGIITYFDLKKSRNKVLYWAIFAFIVLAVFVSFFPLLWILLSSFKDIQEIYNGSFFPSSFDFNKIINGWKILEFKKYFFNSLIITGGAVVVSVLLNGLFAYSTVFVKPIGNKLFVFLVMLSLMIPSVTNMVALYKNLVSMHMVNNPVPLMLVFGANAFYIMMFKSYFESMPKSVIESAWIDGANKIQVFLRIVLPMCKSIIVVVAIFTINNAWSDFMLPFLLLRKDSAQTIMVKLYSLNSDITVRKDLLLMSILFAIIPPIILFSIFQKQITDNVMTSGVKE